MMLMTNDVLAQQFEAPRSKSLLPQEDLPPAEVEDLPFRVTIQDVSCEDRVFELSPVKYTMRVQFCELSFSTAPHRYSDFEKLHEAIRQATTENGEGNHFTATLPEKHLLMPDRAALIKRAAGLSRYCNEVLNNPAALACSAVSTFFELDDNLWRQTSATLTQVIGAVAEHVVARRRAMRSAKRHAQAKEGVDGNDAVFRSPKRDRQAEHDLERADDDQERDSDEGRTKRPAGPRTNAVPAGEEGESEDGSEITSGAWEQLLQPPPSPAAVQTSAWERLVAGGRTAAASAAGPIARGASLWGSGSRARRRQTLEQDPMDKTRHGPASNDLLDVVCASTHFRNDMLFTLTLHVHVHVHVCILIIAGQNVLTHDDGAPQRRGGPRAGRHDAHDERCARAAVRGAEEQVAAGHPREGVARPQRGAHRRGKGGGQRRRR